MTNGIEFQLGQLDAGLKALIGEVRGFHEDIRAQIVQHDERDDERFNSHNARLAAIERRLAIDEDRGVAAEKRRDGWRFLLTVASSSGVGAAVFPQRPAATADVAAAAVLSAFHAAGGRRLVDRYLAGIAAWRRVHPDHARDFAAAQAVDVILAATVRLR